VSDLEALADHELLELAAAHLRKAVQCEPGSPEAESETAAFREAFAAFGEREAARVLRRLATAAERSRPPVSQTFPWIGTPWMAIAADLRYAIDGTLKAGDPLPSLTELAASYKVNRDTAKKALASVTAEGLAVPRPGRCHVKA
jgi:hypothetical protein